jgi:hypothetical protein
MYDIRGITGIAGTRILSTILRSFSRYLIAGRDIARLFDPIPPQFCLDFKFDLSQAGGGKDNFTINYRLHIQYTTFWAQ